MFLHTETSQHNKLYAGTSWNNSSGVKELMLVTVIRLRVSNAILAWVSKLEDTCSSTSSASSKNLHRSKTSLSTQSTMFCAPEFLVFVSWEGKAWGAYAEDQTSSVQDVDNSTTSRRRQEHGLNSVPPCLACYGNNQRSWTTLLMTADAHLHLSEIVKNQVYPWTVKNCQNSRDTFRKWRSGVVSRSLRLWSDICFYIQQRINCDWKLRSLQHHV